MYEQGIVILEGIKYIQSLHCGYCGGIEDPQSKTIEETWALDHLIQSVRCPSSSYGFQVAYLTTNSYQKLIDRGWRRSGSYIYRNDMLRSCCRHYTIRTSLNDLLNGYYKKEHRHSLNRFYKFTTNESSIDSKLGLIEKFESLETNENSKFESILTPAEFADDKYQLFRKYQMCIHHDEEDEVTEVSFDRFLCTNPFTGNDGVDWDQINLEWKQRMAGEHMKSFQGALHECYYYTDSNGERKLIAVAVLDILDHAVSSVYFIYDPDYSHLGLGTVSALREICMAEIWGRNWYYLGYYIPDCKKMKYKAKFGGEILDLGHYGDNGDIDDQWWKLKDIGEILNDGKFHSFDLENGKVVDKTNQLYGINGTNWNITTEVNGETDDFGGLWSSPKHEESFINTKFKKTKVTHRGPHIVPGCHKFPPRKESYKEFLYSAVELIPVYDYRSMRQIVKLSTENARNQFEILRIIGPEIQLLLIS